ncbi:hypothetical protein N7509_007181 [Penicillium cosmopolitanum]|uniref:Zn(2)-C6 fungal-type domain-containing protein n=1 Tax=Penicillium cosmopolitanum TaxID=1131564 RepID=A0A9W9VYN5_9EURO|nr:uncharacterized protein N7509_007181 [Penicillium cosmopolitanum]KAJ5391691.1 hypothetical protein N7509_007181 [Penicillium cosmopolitanum]
MEYRSSRAEGPVELRSNPDTNSTKRRKVRKGTFSCWECKRRKRRCERDLNATICLSCQRHGVSCISQEFTKAPLNDCREIGQRVDHVEALVNKLVRQREARPGRRQQSNVSSGQTVADDTTSFMAPPTLRSICHERLSRGRSLSGYLFSILPHPATSIVILSSSTLFSSPLQKSQAQESTNSTIVHGEPRVSLQFTAHPLVLARRLIQLALCLKQFDASSSKQLECHLNKSISEASFKYQEIATRFVLSQDFLVNSLDGVETLILQSCYHITLGDTRMAWTVQCRAINIACTIGIQNLAEMGDERAEHIWFRLVYSDRFMALMLGIPFTITEESSFWETQRQNSTLSQRLECLHVAIAGRIVTRNVQIQQYGSPQEASNDCNIRYHDDNETKDIDELLKKSAKLLPPTWWLTSSRTNTNSENDSVEKTAKLLVQLHQYYLIILLHQPYLIRLLTCTHDSDSVEQNTTDSTYSKLATASASHEGLLRYLAIRELHQSPTYRPTDDKMYTCAIALLFAHLDGHTQGSANVLDHQRNRDLGLISESINMMEKVSTANNDPRGLVLIRILRNFMALEDAAAEGSTYHTWCDESIQASDDSQESLTEDSISLSIPYFGKIHISCRRPSLSQELDIHSVGLGATMHRSHSGLGHAKNATQPSTRDPTTEDEEARSWFETWIQATPDTEEE